MTAIVFHNVLRPSEDILGGSLTWPLYCVVLFCQIQVILRMIVIFICKFVTFRKCTCITLVPQKLISACSHKGITRNVETMKYSGVLPQCPKYSLATQEPSLQALLTYEISWRRCKQCYRDACPDFRLEVLLKFSNDQQQYLWS